MPRNATASERTAFAKLPAGSEDLRVLVVDDDSLTMRMVGQMMEALGLRVDLANGGRQAQSMVRRNSYAMVLTDYQMPDVDGYALAVWIKKRWRNTLVFVMTGCSPAEVADRVGSHAVDRWMYKPFDLAQLKEALAGTKKIYYCRP
jgi:CheY-like chemotaxis protein